jgi:hypothetical protein
MTYALRFDHALTTNTGPRLDGLIPEAYSPFAQRIFASPAQPAAVTTESDRGRGGVPCCERHDWAAPISSGCRRGIAGSVLAPTVQYVAPAPVVVAAGLSAPREVRGSAHHVVVGAISCRRVGFAPAHVENVQARVGIGLTTGAICARDESGVGRKVVKAALLMSLHLLPLRCRARSGGFAVGRADSGAACPATCWPHLPIIQD